MRTRIAVLLLAFGTAAADVTDVAENGFTSVNTTVVETSAAAAWRVATDGVGRWWNPDHTLSGDTARLSLSATPLDCFCESFGDDAGIVHLTVTAAAPPSLLRMTGGLGPLGVMGVDGNMTWEFEPVPSGTRIRFTYAVGGYAKDGFEEIAAAVDTVVADALERLAAYLATGQPEPADDD